MLPEPSGGQMVFAGSPQRQVEGLSASRGVVRRRPLSVNVEQHRPDIVAGLPVAETVLSSVQPPVDVQGRAGPHSVGDFEHVEQIGQQSLAGHAGTTRTDARRTRRLLVNTRRAVRVFLAMRSLNRNGRLWRRVRAPDCVSANERCEWRGGAISHARTGIARGSDQCRSYPRSARHALRSERAMMPSPPNSMPSITMVLKSDV